MNSSMMDSANWKPVGQVRAIGGSLVFPPVGTARGIYWYRITEGVDEVAGYVGQAAGLEGFAQRFRGYCARIGSPQYTKGGELGTTSRNARKLLAAIKAGAVDVLVLDGPDLADEINPHRDALEIDLIHQLCLSDVREVWNRKYLIARPVHLLTMLAPTDAEQAERDSALEVFPEELRLGLARVTTMLPPFKGELEALAIECFESGRDLGNDEGFDEGHAEGLKRLCLAPCEPEE